MQLSSSSWSTMATRTGTRSRGGPSGPVLGGSKNLIAVDFGQNADFLTYLEFA